MQAMLCITHKRLLAPSYSLVKGPTGAFTRIYYDTIYMKIPLNKLPALDIALGGLCTKLQRDASRHFLLEKDTITYHILLIM